MALLMLAYLLCTFIYKKVMFKKTNSTYLVRCRITNQLTDLGGASICSFIFPLHFLSSVITRLKNVQRGRIK